MRKRGRIGSAGAGCRRPQSSCRSSHVGSPCLNADRYWRRRGGSGAGWNSSFHVDGLASAGGGMIFARALPEKAKVIETYEVDQVISVNPRRTRGKQHTGRIEITVPYDGLRYFTRQAARDVRRGRPESRPAADPDATIGHLLLAEHDHVESLPAGVRMRAEYGVIPISVPLLGTEDLTAGRKASVITHEYQPRDPEIIPAGLEITVMDPDAVDYMSLAEALADTKEDEGLYAKVV